MCYAMHKHNWMKICSVLGSCVILLPTGIQWYWGNMGTYVLSYYHKRSPSVMGSESRWIPSIFLVTRIVGLIVTGYFNRFRCSKLIAVVGIIVFNIGIFTSYMSIHHSVGMLIFTLGGVCGAGAGILYSASLELSVQWVEQDSGLIVSLIQSAYTFGAVIILQFVSLYTNPHNLPPSEKCGEYTFFDQDDVINRVPSTFFIFGSFFIVLQIVGVCLISDRDPKSPLAQRLADSVASETEQTPVILPASSSSQSSLESMSSKDSEFSLRSMLSTKAFYVIWISQFCGNYPYIILTNDYKAFGQLYIKDDHFLSILGTTLVILSVITKVIYGIISDRVGSKVGLIIIYCMLTTSTAFMYVAPNWNKWAYFFVVCMLGIPSGTVLTSHTIAVVHVFGRRNVAINTGLVSSASAVILLAAPPLMSFIEMVGGWASIFYSGASVSLFTLVLIITCL